MTISLRAVLLVLIFDLGLAAQPAANSSGWYQDDCGSTTFHIIGKSQRNPNQEIVLRLKRGYPPLGAYLIGAGWFDAEAKRCSHPEKCVQATRAQLWLDENKDNIKHISGKYRIDFDGENLEGRFLVKYRKHKGVFLCE
jgi:hypothetical protein